MSSRSPELIPASAAPLFAALGDGTRLQLLSRLHDGRPRSLIQLTDGSGLTRQGVSKHLRVLERAGIVRNRRIGRERQFMLEPAGLERARRYLERASRQWDQAAARLQAFLGGRP
jgi:DNA-binding transcriptional ArsR family regulator